MSHQNLEKVEQAGSTLGKRAEQKMASVIEKKNH